VTRVVLKYQGTPAARDAAEAKLRELIPEVHLTRKTSTLVEARIDDAQADALARLDEWTVSLPTYADIGRPTFNLANMRAKLGRNK